MRIGQGRTLSHINVIPAWICQSAIFIESNIKILHKVAPLINIPYINVCSAKHMHLATHVASSGGGGYISLCMKNFYWDTWVAQ